MPLPLEDADPRAAGARLEAAVAEWLSSRATSRSKLVHWSPRHDAEPVRWREFSRRCFGPSMKVEFAVEDGSYSRGYAALDDLWAAFRDDILERVAPDRRADADRDPETVLNHAWRPQLLFEFERLAPILARQLVPSQVVPAA